VVVDVPSAESLRRAARAVRELAGERFLGLCVFRLPALDDPATLTIAQVASALADLETAAKVEIRILHDIQKPPPVKVTSANYVLEVKNIGTASSTIGAVKIDLQANPGTTEPVLQQGSASVEYLCASLGLTSSAEREPCSQRRAKHHSLPTSHIDTGPDGKGTSKPQFRSRRRNSRLD
jgi:hypothetical protein